MGVEPRSIVPLRLRQDLADRFFELFGDVQILEDVHLRAVGVRFLLLGLDLLLRGAELLEESPLGEFPRRLDPQRVQHVDPGGILNDDARGLIDGVLELLLSEESVQIAEIEMDVRLIQFIDLQDVFVGDDRLVDLPGQLVGENLFVDVRSRTVQGLGCHVSQGDDPVGRVLLVQPMEQLQEELAVQREIQLLFAGGVHLEVPIGARVMIVLEGDAGQGEIGVEETNVVADARDAEIVPAAVEDVQGQFAGRWGLAFALLGLFVGIDGVQRGEEKEKVDQGEDDLSDLVEHRGRGITLRGVVLVGEGDQGFDLLVQEVFAEVLADQMENDVGQEERTDGTVEANGEETGVEEMIVTVRGQRLNEERNVLRQPVLVRSQSQLFEHGFLRAAGLDVRLVGQHVLGGAQRLEEILLLLIEFTPQRLIALRLLVLVGEIEIVELQTLLNGVGDGVLLSHLVGSEKGARQLAEQLQGELRRVEIEVAPLEIVGVDLRVGVGEQPIAQRGGRGDARGDLAEVDASGIDRPDLRQTVDGRVTNARIGVIRPFEQGQEQAGDQRGNGVAGQTHLQQGWTRVLQQVVQTVQRVKTNVHHVEVEQGEETLEFALQQRSFVVLALLRVFDVLLVTLVQLRSDLLHLAELRNEKEIVGDLADLRAGDVRQHQQGQLLEVFGVDRMEGKERGDQLEQHRGENLLVRAQMTEELLPESEDDLAQLRGALQRQTKGAKKLHPTGDDLHRVHDLQHFGQTEQDALLRVQRSAAGE